MSIDAQVDIQPPFMPNQPSPFTKTPSSTDPTAIYLWDEPIRVPHDKVLWSVRADVRGNFPGFTKLPNVIANATIRLSANFLVIARAPYFAAIPTSAIQRITLEGGGTPNQGAILSVDYADSLGQLRRIWLGVRPRLGGALWTRRAAMGTRWQAAGISEVRLTPLVPGIRRMGNREEHPGSDAETPRWRTAARIGLGSGEELGLLAGYADHLSVICGECLLRLPYADVLGFATLPASTGSGETPIFLNFMDADVMLSLRVVLPEQADGGYGAAEVIAALRDQGVLTASVDDLLALVATAKRGTDATARDPVALADAMSPAPAPASQAGDHPALRDPVPESGGDVPAERQTWSLGTTWMDGAARRERYAALVRHIVEEREVYMSLHAAQLLSDDDLEDHRKRMLAEIRALHRLIQVTLLHEAGLVDQREFGETRQELLRDLAIKGGLTNGNA